MAYTDAANTEGRGPAVIGVAAIHAALGLAIVTGLAGGVVEIATRDVMDVFDVRKDPPPPEPPVPDPLPKADTKAAKKQTKTFVPPVESGLNTSSNEIDAGTAPTSFGEEETGPIGNPGTGSGLEKPITPLSSFDPIAPAPRNSEWVTNNDYRTSWIRRGMEGTAGFRLTIDANGRVSNCTITQSTGHRALDQATCRLVKRRAEFNPGKDTQGDAVSGTFSSAVLWQIPE